MGARFDAPTDTVEYSGPGVIPDPSTAITITAWVKIGVDRDTWSTLIRLSDPVNNTVGNLATDADGRSPAWFTSGGSIVTTHPLPLGEWRPVAFACTGTAGKIYQGDINGDLAFTDTGTVDGAPLPSLVALGGRYTGESTEWFNGSLAFVRIWSAEMTPAQIEAEWKSSAPVITSGLVAHWPLTATSLADTSGNGRNLAAGSTALAADDTNVPEAPIFRSKSATVFSDGLAAITVNAPPGAQENDLILIPIHVDAPGVSYTNPHGFTLVGVTPTAAANIAQHLYAKIAGPSEPASYTFTRATGSGFQSAVSTAWARVNSTTPFDTGADEADSGTTGVNTSPPVEITTLGANRMVIFTAQNWAGSAAWTLPPGFVEYARTSFDVTVLAAKVQAAAGLTGVLQATATPTDKMTAHLVALRPVSADLASPWTLWDGAAEEPLTMSGMWNGSSIVPLTFDEVTV